MLEFVNYIILGLIWVLIWEYIEKTHNKRELSNEDRFVHIFLWPIWCIIFIVGYFRGLFGDFDDE